MSKKFVVGLVLLWISLLMLLVYITQPVKACEGCEIKVVYNNKAVKFTNGFPITYKDRTFLGLRSTGEMLGLTVDWDSKEQVAWVYNSDRSNVVRIQMKQGKAYVNDEMAYLSAPAMIIDNRVFVPVRFIAEAFNKKVTYVASTKIINIKDADLGEQELF